MNYFRKHSGWLCHRVDAIITKKHPDLVDSCWLLTKNWCNRNILDRKRWYVIVVLVGLIFYCSPYVHFFEWIDIKRTTSEIIIDQRTTNLAAIIAMSIAVVGFLISNLAVKEAFAYELLFYRSKIYSIIYFTLSLIGFLIIFSMLRNHIKSDFIYSRLIVTGTYLALVVLFLIGYLFRIIIRFTNSKKIYSLLEERLLDEGRKFLKQESIKKYSAEEYMRFMRSIRTQRFDSGFVPNLDEFIAQNENQNNAVSPIVPTGKIIKDIDLYGLAAFVAKKRTGGHQVFFRECALGDEFTDYNLVWVVDNPNTPPEQKILQSLIKTGKSLPEIKIDSDVRKYFDDKVEEYASKSEYKSLDPFLKSLVKLYEFQMKNKTK